MRIATDDQPEIKVCQRGRSVGRSRSDGKAKVIVGHCGPVQGNSSSLHMFGPNSSVI